MTTGGAGHCSVSAKPELSLADMNKKLEWPMVCNDCCDDSEIVEMLLVDCPKIMRHVELSPKF